LQLRSLGRGRARVIAAAAVWILAVVLVVGRYVWLHEERRDTEHHVATTTGQLREALALFREVESTRAAQDTRNTTTETQRNQLRTMADALRQELDLTKATQTATEVGAFTEGAQANNLRACLTGVQQALNQLAVGDGGEIKSLKAVEGSCRQAGIQ
jgi:hypothetical protein